MNYDITFCEGESCTLKEQCHRYCELLRYRADKNKNKKLYISMCRPTDPNKCILFWREKGRKMSKMKRLLVAIIIVTTLAWVCLVSGLIAKLLILLPSPWCHIVIVSYLVVVLVGGVYVILGKIEQEKNNHVKLD